MSGEAAFGSPAAAAQGAGPTNRQFAAFWLGVLLSTGGVALWSLWQSSQSLLYWAGGTLDLAIGTALILYSGFLQEEDDEPS